MKRGARRLARAGAALGVTLAALWLSGVRLFAFPGESMAPTVRPGEHFLALTGFWQHGTPQRFDLVIYDVPPESKWAARKIPWMKRLVGLPGEHVRLSGARLFVNERLLDAPFLHRENETKPRADFEIRLRADEFFFLGDNLDRSFDDSRTMGPIRRELLRGRVAFVVHH